MKGCVIMNNKLKTGIVIALFFAFVTVFISSALHTRDVYRERYRYATELMNNGKYEEAYEAFSSFNDGRSSYRDSLELAEDCKLCMEYEKACDYASEQDYLNAVIAFSKLGDFKDSPERLKRYRDRLISYITVVADAEESAVILNTLIDQLLADNKEVTTDGGE